MFLVLIPILEGVENHASSFSVFQERVLLRLLPVENRGTHMGRQLRQFFVPLLFECVLNKLPNDSRDNASDVKDYRIINLFKPSITVILTI